MRVMEMKKILSICFFSILSGLLFPNLVWAESSVEFACPKEVVVGKEIACVISLKTNSAIQGVSTNYDFSSDLSYLKTDIGSNWTKLTENKDGLVVVNANGISKDDVIATVYYDTTEAEIYTEYEIQLKDISLSDGEKDILLENQVQVVKVKGTSSLLSNLVIGDNLITLQDDVTNYTVEVAYEIEKIEIEASLSEDSYQFVEGYGPRVISDLKVGDNVVYLKAARESGEDLVYEIHIQRLSREGEVVTENPKTGVGYLLVVVVILIVSLGMISYYKQKMMNRV